MIEEYDLPKINAVYKCKTHQRSHRLVKEGKVSPALGLALNRDEDEVISIEGVRGTAYISADQPERKTSPLTALKHDSDVPLMWEFIIEGYTKQDEEGVIRCYYENLKFLDEK